MPAARARRRSAAGRHRRASRRTFACCRPRSSSLAAGKEVFVVADAVGSRRETRPRSRARAPAPGGRADRVARDGGLRMAGRGRHAAVQGNLRTGSSSRGRMNLIARPCRAGARAVARIPLARGDRARLRRLRARWSSASSTAGPRSRASSPTIAALAPPVLLAAGASAWRSRRCIRCGACCGTSSCLYLLMGFRRFSHAYTDIVTALRAGDIAAARRALAGMARQPLPASFRAARSRSSRSSAGWSTRTVRCSRCCSGSPCFPGRPARCSIARRRCSRGMARRRAAASEATPIGRARAISAVRRGGCCGCSTGFRCA